MTLKGTSGSPQQTGSQSTRERQENTLQWHQTSLNSLCGEKEKQKNKLIKYRFACIDFRLVKHSELRLCHSSFFLWNISKYVFIKHCILVAQLHLCLEVILFCMVNRHFTSGCSVFFHLRIHLETTEVPAVGHQYHMSVCWTTIVVQSFWLQCRHFAQSWSSLLFLFCKTKWALNDYLFLNQYHLLV